jgi:DNA-binding NarL/FixJ family response regulator
MSKPIDFEGMHFGGWLWSLLGRMRVVLLPAEIEPEDLPRAMTVGLHFLDKREWQLAELLAGGVTRKEMADSLNLSDDQVGDGLRELYRKLGVLNEKQACVMLGRYGVSVSGKRK